MLVQENSIYFLDVFAGAAALATGGSNGCPLSFPRSLMPIALSIFPRICWLGIPRPAS